MSDIWIFTQTDPCATSSPGPSAWEAPDKRVIRRELILTRRALGTKLIHVSGVCLPSQSAVLKYNQEKTPIRLCAPREFLKNVSAMFDNHTILLLWLKNKQNFHMFSLRDLRFVLCSRDLDVLRAQRIMGFFILITHKSTRSENQITWLGTCS